VAFIAIHKSKPATPQEIEPFIQESSIYIARKSDHFKPVHLAVKVELDGRSWKVVREPKLAPGSRDGLLFRPQFDDSLEADEHQASSPLLWGARRCDRLLCGVGVEIIQANSFYWPGMTRSPPTTPRRAWAIPAT
jgi:hypothetical protein